MASSQRDLPKPPIFFFLFLKFISSTAKKEVSSMVSYHDLLPSLPSQPGYRSTLGPNPAGSNMMVQHATDAPHAGQGPPLRGDSDSPMVPGAPPAAVPHTSSHLPSSALGHCLGKVLLAAVHANTQGSSGTHTVDIGPCQYLLKLRFSGPHSVHHNTTPLSKLPCHAWHQKNSLQSRKASMLKEKMRANSHQPTTPLPYRGPRLQAG